MILKEVFVQAFISLIEHRFRAAMTMLGIAWGIVTVVLLMAYGNGFHRALMVGFRGAPSQTVWSSPTEDRPAPRLAGSGQANPSG
jgi:putative ABC transport system permease protein